MKEVFRQIDKVLLGSVSMFMFFILGFIWWIFDYNTVVPMWILSAVIIVCFLICIIIYAVFSTRKVNTVYRLPEIRGIHKENYKIIFVVEYNELFNQGSYATICYQAEEEGLEIVLGLGYVQTINSQGLLQIVMEKLLDDQSVIDIYGKIENTSFYKKAIKIKPSIHKNLFEEA